MESDLLREMREVYNIVSKIKYKTISHIIVNRYIRTHILLNKLSKASTLT